MKFDNSAGCQTWRDSPGMYALRSHIGSNLNLLSPPIQHSPSFPPSLPPWWNHRPLHSLSHSLTHTEYFNLNVSIIHLKVMLFFLMWPFMHHHPPHLSSLTWKWDGKCLCQVYPLQQYRALACLCTTSLHSSKYFLIVSFLLFFSKAETILCLPVHRVKRQNNDYFVWYSSHEALTALRLGSGKSSKASTLFFSICFLVWLNLCTKPVKCIMQEITPGKLVWSVLTQAMPTSFDQ